MANDYFDSADFTELTRATLARAESLNAIFDAIIVAFDNLPTLTEIRQGRITYAADASTVANTILLNLPYAPEAYAAGLLVFWTNAVAVTGASAINIDSLGVKNLKRYDLSATESGDLPVGAVGVALYDGTQFQLLWPLGGILASATAQAVAAAASAATASGHATTASTGATTATAQAVIATAQAVLSAASAAAAAASAGSALRLFLGAVGGTADAMTSAVVLAALADGMLIEFDAVGTNTVTAPTININSLGAATIKDQDGNALTVGAILSGRHYSATYHSTGTCFRLHRSAASQAVAEAGTDNVASMTALRTAQAIAVLATVAAASESTAGKAEVATQTEHDTGTDDGRISTPLKVATAPYTIGRNVLVNGAMEIWQEGTASATATSGSRNYLADQWYVNPSGANMAQVRSTTVPTGSKARYSLQVTGATSGTTCLFGQRVPACEVPMVNGYATFSFLVYNGSGSAFTPNLLIGTPASADAFTTVTNRLTQALQSCADAGWTRVTCTVDISGYTNLANGIQVELQIPSGSLDSGAKLVRVTECQGEAGRVRTALERLPEPLELLRCQKYLFTWASSDGVIGDGFADGNTTANVAVRFPTTMRAAPTFAASDVTHFSVDVVSGTSGATTGLTAAGLSTDGCEMRPVRATSTWTAGQGLRLLFANASAKMYFRARL